MLIGAWNYWGRSELLGRLGEYNWSSIADPTTRGEKWLNESITSKCLECSSMFLLHCLEGFVYTMYCKSATIFSSGSFWW